MKSERRHELDKNELAGWLETFGKDAGPHVTTILAALAVCVLLYAAYNWYSQNAQAATADAWNSYFNAYNGGAGELDDVARQHPGSEVAGWALVTGADLRSANACDQLFANRSMATQELNKAVNGYLDALKLRSLPSLLRERATYGLARAYEAQGNVDEATKNYDAVVKEWPEGTYAMAATRRLDDLKLLSTRKFYEQFAKAGPKPTETKSDAAFPGSRVLDFNDKALPEGPTTKKPEGEKKDAPAATAPAKPAETKPAETKPADAKAAETKPAETKPAAKPADTKPAEAKPADAKPVETKPAAKSADTKPADKPADAKK